MHTDRFEWTAFDPNRWDHYYHAGHQVRFFRVAPWHQAMDGMREAPKPGFLSRCAEHVSAFVRRNR